MSTTATWARMPNVTAAHSQRLTNRRWKALVVSERELNALKSWARTMVVKPHVLATSRDSLPSISPPSWKMSVVSRVEAAMTAPTISTPAHMRRSMTRSSSRLGGRDITSSVSAHRQGWRRVRGEVDPQDLGGKQRQHHRRLRGMLEADDPGQHHPPEHGQHLAYVGGQQVSEELRDVELPEQRACLRRAGQRVPSGVSCRHGRTVRRQRSSSARRCPRERRSPSAPMGALGDLVPGTQTTSPGLPISRSGSRSRSSSAVQRVKETHDPLLWHRSAR